MPQSALVCHLNKERIDWCSEFRVCRKYRNPAYANVLESIELCFMDKQGDIIQGTVTNALISKFDDELNEDDLVAITQFSVVDNSRTFPMADSMYKFMFQKKTLVQRITRKMFPKSMFSFKSFADILSGGHRDTNPLFDIIGEIVDIKDSRLRADGASSKSTFVELLLEDLDGKRLPCLLWEPYCNQFQGLADYLRGGQRKECVVAIQLCRTRLFKGGLGVSNTYHATKVFFRVEIDELVEYRFKLPSTVNSRPFDGSQFSGEQVLPVKEELELETSIVLSIGKMKQAELAMRVWIVGCVSEVIYDWDWCYNSCLQCKKKVLDKEAKLHCLNCKTFVIGSTRYKIHVRVCDGTGFATLLLWNDVAYEMIGVLASTVAGSCAALEDAEVSVPLYELKTQSTPEAVDDLVGREFVFKVSVEHRHINGTSDVYHVERVSEDADLVEKYKQTDHGLGFGESNEQSSVLDDICSPELVQPSQNWLFSPPPVSGRLKRCIRPTDGASGSSKVVRKFVIDEDEDEGDDELPADYVTQQEDGDCCNLKNGI